VATPTYPSGARGSQSTATVANAIPLDIRRRYDLSDQIIWKEYIDAPLLTILSTRAQKQTTADPVFKALEDGWPTMGGSLTTNTSLTDTAFTIASASTYIQAGDIIHFPQNQTNNSNSASSDIMGENCIVQSVTGTSVTVSRANGAGGSNTSGVTDSTGSGLSFILIGNAFKEGSAAPEGLSDKLQYESNQVQIFRETWEVTNTLNAMTLVGGKDEPRLARKARKKFMREIERAFLFGQNRTVMVGTKPKRYTRGVLSFLTEAQTEDSTLGLPAHTAWSAANDLVTGNETARTWKVGDVSDEDNWGPKILTKGFEAIYRKGNMDKVGICGAGFMTEVQNMLWKYVRMEPMQDLFGMKVLTLDFLHGRLQLIQHREFSLQSAYNHDCLILDMPYFSYKFLPGRDVKVETAIQLPGEDTVQNGLIAEIGLGHNFWESHSYVTGMTNTT